MRYVFLALMLLLLTVAAAWQSLCTGSVACCMETLCVDCECQECLREGGVPLGANTTCDSDRCRCCEHPICTADTLCHTVYNYCCDYAPCWEAWVRPFDSRAQFCDCVEQALWEAELLPEHVCADENAMGIFIALLSGQHPVPSIIPAAPTAHPMNSVDSLILLMIPLLALCGLLTLMYYCCCHPVHL